RRALTQPNSCQAINATGQIVGGYQAADYTFHGFLLDNGSYTPLDVPGASFTEARGINDSGQIVESYCNGDCFVAAGFLLDNGNYTTLDEVPGRAGACTWPEAPSP